MEFTAEMASTMTPEQIREFWIQRQRENRAAGHAYYETLEEADTGKVVATI